MPAPCNGARSHGGIAPTGTRPCREASHAAAHLSGKLRYVSSFLATARRPPAGGRKWQRTAAVRGGAGSGAQGVGRPEGRCACGWHTCPGRRHTCGPAAVPPRWQNPTRAPAPLPAPACSKRLAWNTSSGGSRRRLSCFTACRPLAHLGGRKGRQGGYKHACQEGRSEQGRLVRSPVRAGQHM